MTVYVDNARHPYGRMLLCHMVADTTAELLYMADRIGVARRHIQHVNTEREHFDICQSKRALAVKAGAREITQRQLGRRLLTRQRLERDAPRF
jgi:hypothetical protein